MKDSITYQSEGKDERMSSVLVPIYRVGFYILAGGVLFDVYSRFNYLVRTGGGTLGESNEVAALVAALALVALAKARSGAVSDSLRVLEAETFGGTGLVWKSAVVSLLIGAASTLGRLPSEDGFGDWTSVIWLNDVAIFVIVSALSAAAVLGYLYCCWHSYRSREDGLPGRATPRPAEPETRLNPVFGRFVTLSSYLHIRGIGAPRGGVTTRRAPRWRRDRKTRWNHSAGIGTFSGQVPYRVN
ncbi:hypothetical protein [Fannyhessea vaginae]|uniref:hypothetical protein n=1 Tax=Fannyhessea vaginae TaxID=82135 RepID=UPI00288BC53F|nr:hypothetical protein [Fannyhessea vaginae]